MLLRFEVGSFDLAAQYNKLLSQQSVFDYQFGLAPADISEGSQELGTTGWLLPNRGQY